MRLFAEYGFEPRKGSEDIKTQWIDANDRRILASNTLKNIVKSLPNPPAFGKQRPDSVIRMKTNNPMLNHETRIKSGNAIAKFYKENATKHIIYHKKLTDNEQRVFDYLSKKGITCIGNESVNGRFADIFIPELKIIIECVNHSRFPLSYDRHKQISGDNYHVVYCTNDFIKKSDLDILYQYIIRINVFSLIKSFDSQISVFFGRRAGLFFDFNFSQFPFKTINMNKVNISFLATSSDYNVSFVNTINSFPSSTGQD